MEEDDNRIDKTYFVTMSPLTLLPCLLLLCLLYFVNNTAVVIIIMNYEF